MEGVKNREGFTLAEILISLSILLIIYGLGALVSTNFSKSQTFGSEQYNLITILRKARSQAMSNINQSDYGVFISSSSYVIFQGSSFASLFQFYARV